jgi:hypothetical protein
MSGACSMPGAMKNVYRNLIGYFKRRDNWKDVGCEHSKDEATLLFGLGRTPRRTCLRKCGRHQERWPGTLAFSGSAHRLYFKKRFTKMHCSSDVSSHSLNEQSVHRNSPFAYHEHKVSCLDAP